MRTRGSLARCLDRLPWLAALLLACPAALAAPARRHPPKHAVKAAPPSPPTTEDDDASAKPEADALAERDERRAPKSDEPAPAKPQDRAAGTLGSEPTLGEEASPTSEAALTPDHEARGNSDDEALGRRELARIAAGRVEVAVLASVDVGSRHFRYSDPVGRLLAPYRLGAAPMTSFGLEAYPLASSNVPALRDLGFRGHLSRAFALGSKTPDGTPMDTSWTRFGGELRERLLVPGPHAFELGIDAGLDASYFVMSSKSRVLGLLPTARSIALRFGLDARLRVAGRFSLLLGGAYLLAATPGEIYERFRDPHVAGVDGDFGCVLGLTPGLEARITARYTRYFATFKPKVGDSAVAGGALDEQLELGLGVRYAH